MGLEFFNWASLVVLLFLLIKLWRLVYRFAVIQKSFNEKVVLATSNIYGHLISLAKSDAQRNEIQAELEKVLYGGKKGPIN